MADIVELLRSNNTDELKTLLNSGVVDPDGEVELGGYKHKHSLIWLACKSGSRIFVRWYLEKTIEPDGIQFADEDMKEKLINLYADAACGTSDTETFLSLLTSTDYHSALMPGFMVGMTPFFLACCNGRDEVVRLLLLQDDIDISSPMESGVCSGATPLYAACASGREAVVKLLLEQENIDISSPLENGRDAGKTPAFIACAYGHTKVVELLLSKKKNLDITLPLSTGHCQGMTPLYAACAFGRAAVVRLLLSHNNQDIMLPLESGAYKGNTPFFGACRGRHAEVVNLLLPYVTDKLIKNYTLEQRKEILEYVFSIEQQAANKEKLLKTFCPLYIACLDGDVDTIKKLVSENETLNLLTDDLIVQIQSNIMAFDDERRTEICEALVDSRHIDYIQSMIGYLFDTLEQMPYAQDLFAICRSGDFSAFVPELLLEDEIKEAMCTLKSLFLNDQSNDGVKLVYRCVERNLSLVPFQAQFAIQACIQRATVKTEDNQLLECEIPERQTVTDKIEHFMQANLSSLLSCLESKSNLIILYKGNYGDGQAPYYVLTAFCKEAAASCHVNSAVEQLNHMLHRNGIDLNEAVRALVEVIQSEQGSTPEVAQIALRDYVLRRVQKLVTDINSRRDQAGHEMDVEVAVVASTATVLGQKRKRAQMEAGSTQTHFFEEVRGGHNSNGSQGSQSESDESSLKRQHTNSI